jgi:hypothetical protein
MKVFSIPDSVLQNSPGTVLFAMSLLDQAVESDLINRDQQISFELKCIKLQQFRDNSGHILFGLFESGEKLNECIDVLSGLNKLTKLNDQIFGNKFEK